jgi:hypothetical protein
MKTSGDLDGCEPAGRVRVPVGGVIEHVAQLRCDLVWLDADVGDPLAALASPLPHHSEHAFVELVGERSGQQVLDRVAHPRVEHPQHGALDPVVFDRVEVGAGRHLGRDQARQVVLVEWGRPGNRFSQGRHRSRESISSLSRTRSWAASSLLSRPWSSRIMVRRTASVLRRRTRVAAASTVPAKLERGTSA